MKNRYRLSTASPGIRLIYIYISNTQGAYAKVRLSDRREFHFEKRKHPTIKRIRSTHGSKEKGSLLSRYFEAPICLGKQRNGLRPENTIEPNVKCESKTDNESRSTNGDDQTELTHDYSRTKRSRCLAIYLRMYNVASIFDETLIEAYHIEN